MALLVASRPHEGFEDPSQPKRKDHPNGCVHRAEQPTPEDTRRVVEGDDDRPAESDGQDGPPPNPHAEKEPSEYRRRNASA